MELEITQEEFDKYLQTQEKKKNKKKFSFNEGDICKLKVGIPDNNILKDDLYIINYCYEDKVHKIVDNNKINSYEVYYIVNNLRNGKDYKFPIEFLNLVCKKEHFKGEIKESLIKKMINQK